MCMCLNDSTIHGCSVEIHAHVAHSIREITPLALLPCSHSTRYFAGCINTGRMFLLTGLILWLEWGSFVKKIREMLFFFLSVSMPRTQNQEILSVDRLKRQCRLGLHWRRVYLFALHQHSSTWIYGSLWESSVKLGEKGTRERERELFPTWRPCPFFYSNGITLCVTVVVLFQEKKGSPLFSVRVKTTDSRANTNVL